MGPLLDVKPRSSGDGDSRGRRASSNFQVSQSITEITDSGLLRKALAA